MHLFHLYDRTRLYFCSVKIFSRATKNWRDVRKKFNIQARANIIPVSEIFHDCTCTKVQSCLHRRQCAEGGRALNEMTFLHRLRRTKYRFQSNLYHCKISFPDQRDSREIQMQVELSNVTKFCTHTSSKYSAINFFFFTKIEVFRGHLCPLLRGDIFYFVYFPL